MTSLLAHGSLGCMGAVIFVDDNHLDRGFAQQIAMVEARYACKASSYADVESGMDGIETALAEAREDSVFVVVLDLMFNDARGEHTGIACLRECAKKFRNAAPGLGFEPRIVVYTNKSLTVDLPDAYCVIHKAGGADRLVETLGFLLGREAAEVWRRRGEVCLIDEGARKCSVDVELGMDWRLRREFSTAAVPPGFLFVGQQVDVVLRKEMHKGRSERQILSVEAPKGLSPLSVAEARRLIDDLRWGNG